MKLRFIEKGRYSVAVTIEQSGHCEVLDFLKNIPPNYQSSAKGFRSLFERYAKGGRQLLTESLFHEANKENDIWEFIKGQLRIYCFKDDRGQLVILSHGIVKKSQKAKKQDIEKAFKLREEYLKAKEKGEIEVLENEQ